MKENEIIKSIANLDLPNETTLHVDASEVFCDAIDRINHMSAEVRATTEIKIACSERASKTHTDGTIETIPAKMMIQLTPFTK